ncbi:MAG: bifunctional folylpolyglutamate synthase/dihydrofolate synthase [Clostridia bacterium]|nr:bifunctional folylpolyglutamate synthase/dihydrofolate synthase [Clostridia bacterium]
MTYTQALDFIHSTCWKGSRPGLERTIDLTARLGNPQNSLKFIHIAGTNGKGSTSAMLAAILQRAGYRVGLYTSPFILRFNERMRINGQDIPDGELAEITEYVKPHAEAMADTPTEFELITAIALVYFARHNCDYVVFEVGMGGRLDSTNIIPPETVAASVITGIAMDHTAFLGDTPEKIAAEKAGIIKAGVPVVFGGNHAPIGEVHPDPVAIATAESCARVIREKAAEVGAPYTETDHSKLANIRADLFGADFDFGERKDLHISLAGLYQPYNTATVLTVIDLLRERGLTIPEEAIREGLASVKWPARFEVLSKDPLIIADGGHNPEGIDAAIESVKTYFKDEKILLLTGVMADKDYDRMVARMGEVASRAFCVRPANDRALDPAKYAESFRAIGIPAKGYATVAEGVRAAAETAKREGKALLCLGSLYMYGEVRAAVLGEVEA